MFTSQPNYIWSLYQNISTRIDTKLEKKSLGATDVSVENLLKFIMFVPCPFIKYYSVCIARACALAHIFVTVSIKSLHTLKHIGLPFSLMLLLLFLLSLKWWMLTLPITHHNFAIYKSQCDKWVWYLGLDGVHVCCLCVLLYDEMTSVVWKPLFRFAHFFPICFWWLMDNIPYVFITLVL